MAQQDKKQRPVKAVPEHDSEALLAEIRDILIKKGLLDKAEALVPGMLEDLVHYAYFTSCIPKSEVQRLLGLSKKEAKERIKAWKRHQEGNRSCQLRQNPFYEEWPTEEEKE